MFIWAVLCQAALQSAIQIKNGLTDWQVGTCRLAGIDHWWRFAGTAGHVQYGRWCKQYLCSICYISSPGEQICVSVKPSTHPLPPLQWEKLCRALCACVWACVHSASTRVRLCVGAEDGENKRKTAVLDSFTCQQQSIATPYELHKLETANVFNFFNNLSVAFMIFSITHHLNSLWF